MKNLSNETSVKRDLRQLVVELLYLKEIHETNSVEFDETVQKCVKQFYTKNIHKGTNQNRSRLSWFSKSVKLIIFPILVLCILAYSPWTPECQMYKSAVDNWLASFPNIFLSLKHFKDERCLVEFDVLGGELSRPVMSCDICGKFHGPNKTEVATVVENISQKDFMAQYAYSRLPLLVRGGCNHWKARELFSLQWFRQLYNQHRHSLDVQDGQGQFFPYSSGFESLEEALFMNETRQRKPWYFGWSNAIGGVKQTLRQYYERPTFLPSDGENVAIDWIFMGTPGYGADMHLDNVGRASWQAQVSGTKEWYLRPPAECISICQSQYNVTVHEGDIFILDTNFWFHGTLVLPGNVSIAIGSEYE